MKTWRWHKVSKEQLNTFLGLHERKSLSIVCGMVIIARFCLIGKNLDKKWCGFGCACCKAWQANSFQMLGKIEGKKSVSPSILSAVLILIIWNRIACCTADIKNGINKKMVFSFYVKRQLLVASSDYSGRHIIKRQATVKDGHFLLTFTT